MTLLFLLLGSGLLLSCACAAWWRASRSHGRLVAASAPAAGVATGPAEATSSSAAHVSDASVSVVVPDGRALLHRLYAVAFDDAPVDGPIPAAHLAVAIEAEALLS